MMKVRRTTAIGLGLAVLSACMAVLGCSQRPGASSAQSADMPPLDLNTIEECQRADLGRYWGSTFRFHLYGCEADVTFSDRGEVLAFEPNDAALCRQVIESCRP